MKNEDVFAKGMVESGEEHYDLTPELDHSQYQMIRPYLGREVLEVGAGAGRISKFLLEDKTLAANFMISEPSDHFYKLLVKRFKNYTKVNLSQSETSKLSKEFLAHFDTIFSVDVMEHIEDDLQFLKECSSMIKPTGRIVILVPALQFLYSDLDRNIGHYRRYNKAMIKALANKLDLEIESIYYSNFLGIFASFFFIKLRKLDYQKNESNKNRFIYLQKIYSKYFIPLMNFIERIVPAPLGLNLTCVLKKPN